MLARQVQPAPPNPVDVIANQPPPSALTPAWTGAAPPSYDDPAPSANPRSIPVVREVERASAEQADAVARTGDEDAARWADTRLADTWATEDAPPAEDEEPR